VYATVFTAGVVGAAVGDDVVVALAALAFFAFAFAFFVLAGFEVVAAGFFETVLLCAAGVCAAGAVGVAVAGTVAVVAGAAGATGAAGISLGIGVELAANSAICEFQAKLEMIARNAEDETVAVAIRARRAGWGLRVNNLVIILILAFIVIAFIAFIFSS
jgi:hypothetical protein